MPDRRGRKGSADDLLPNSRAWAEEIWRDREDVAKTNSGGWMIRHAADLHGHRPKPLPVHMTVAP